METILWDRKSTINSIKSKFQTIQFKYFSGSVDIEKVINGVRDQWIKLDSVSHGEIHLRFTWLMLSSDYTKLEEITQDTKWVLNKEKLSTGLLTVYIKSAQNLPVIKIKKGFFRM